jgi:hypothetical protein
MKKLLGLAIVVAVVVGAQATSAQTRNTSATRQRLVRAHCTTGPCNPFFTFQSGSALIKRAKQPKIVTNKKLGKARVIGLQRIGVMGPLIPAALDARLSGTIFYGDDAMGGAACPLANTIVSGEFASGNLQCALSVDGTATCGGTTFFNDLTDPECSDVSQVIQDVRVEIYEFGFAGDPTRLIATGGMNILGKAPDCASGGAGCP